MRVLRLGPEEIWIDTEPEGIGGSPPPGDVSRSGGVEVSDVGEERALLSLIGPAQPLAAGTADLPEHSERQP